MPHVINSRALTGKKPCINKAIHALLMYGYATFNMIVPGPHICCVARCVLPGPKTSIVRENCVRKISVKRRNEIVQEITRNVANVFSFYAIIAIEHGFQCINIRRVPWEVLKTAALGLGCQHLFRDLANVIACKTMFDSFILTKHAFICNRNELCLILQQITEQKSMTQKIRHFVTFRRIFLTSFVISWTLDCVTSIFRIRYITDRRKCICFSQGSRRGFIEQWQKVGTI